MINRSQSFKPEPLNIVGSSTFGKFPKISIETTYNMYISDNWLVNYVGYKKAIPASMFGNASAGRALRTSAKLGKMIGIFDGNVYTIDLKFNQRTQQVYDQHVVLIGQIQTNSGTAWIAENNKPQILISDETLLYVYDQNASPVFQVATKNGTLPISFIPGYIDFHDTYFLCAASADGFYTPVANNTWRLSAQNNGLLWADDAASIGLLETKPDDTQAVVRFPSKGNMIFVFGENVIEPWFDVGYQLFPYQRNSSFNIDYGCITPKSIATMDEMVVWLGRNEKGGAVIYYSEGGLPHEISSDGINFLLENMQDPSDCEAFIMRQDGHIFYHINFYTDNISLFYDFTTKKFFHASDENNNYFIVTSVAFFKNQYYGISNKNGNLYVLDTRITTYDGVEIPRSRTCRNIRNIQQEPFIANDCGFTIESGNTDYEYQDQGVIYLLAENGNYLVTEGSDIYLMTEDGKYLLTEDGKNLITEQVDPNEVDYLICEQDSIVPITPCVDLAISIDGGDNFSSFDRQVLPGLGNRINKLAWWQLGWANDLVCQFRFWGLGRFTATDGVVNIRN